MSSDANLQVRISDELRGWIREDAAEVDVSTSYLVEVLLRAAYKKIGVGEAIRIGLEAIPARPYRARRPVLPWKVVRTGSYRGRAVPEEFRLGHYRLEHKGDRRDRTAEDREPHGRQDQSLAGWYLTGPDLGTPFVWLGKHAREARRESVLWVTGYQR